jgi:hypothetical protein
MAQACEKDKAEKEIQQQQQNRLSQSLWNDQAGPSVVGAMHVARAV